MNITEKINKNIDLNGFQVGNDKPLKNIPEPLPTHVFGWLIVGMPGSGKTSLYTSLLLGPYKKKFHKIYYFNSSINTASDKLIGKIPKERQHTSLSDLQTVIDEFNENKKERKLLILDDLVFEIEKYKFELTRLLMNRRHLGVRILMITQKITSIPLALRSQFDTISYFSGYNKRENERLFKDIILSLDEQQFHNIIDYVFKEKYDFLHIDIPNNKYYKKFNLLQFNNV